MVESTDSAGADLSALKIDEDARGSTGGGKKWLVALAAVVAAALAAVAALAIFGRSPVVETAAARPAPGAALALLNASGYITPRRRATVAAKITARVVDVYVDEGMDVTEGQVLARLDDVGRATAAGRRARRRGTPPRRLCPDLEVNLANAEREFKRQRGPASGTRSRRRRRSTTPARPPRVCARRSMRPGSRCGPPRLRSEWRGRTWTTARCARRSPGWSFPRTRSAARWCRRSRPAAGSRAPGSPRSWTWPRSRSRSM